MDKTEQDFQNRALDNQEMNMAGELTKIGIAQRQIIENNTQFNQFLVDFDKRLLTGEDKVNSILGKDVKTTYLSGKATDKELLARKIRHLSFINTKQLPKYTALWQVDIYGAEIGLSSSVKGNLIKDIFSFGIKFNKDKDKNNDSGVIK